MIHLYYKFSIHSCSHLLVFSSNRNLKVIFMWLSCFYCTIHKQRMVCIYIYIYIYIYITTRTLFKKLTLKTLDPKFRYSFRSYYYFLFCCIAATQRGSWPLHSWGFCITHNDATQSVVLLWASDQLIAETSTWQHTTFTTDKHPWLRWDSNPRSQQASGRRPTP